MYRKNNIWEDGEKERIGSFASHLEISDDEFKDLLAAEKLSKFRSWYKNPGMRMQTYTFSVPF